MAASCSWTSPSPDRSNRSEDRRVGSDWSSDVCSSDLLQYGQGKTISNQHGERMMYSLTDGRVMFLDLAVAGQIESAGINVRESFTITRKTDGPKGSPT